MLQTAMLCEISNLAMRGVGIHDMPPGELGTISQQVLLD
jgi:hypothetical protein